MEEALQPNNAINLSNCNVTFNLINDAYQASDTATQAAAQPAVSGMKEWFKALPPSQQLILGVQWAHELPLNLAVWLNTYVAATLHSSGDWALAGNEDLLKVAKDRLEDVDKKMSGGDYDFVHVRAAALSVIAHLAMLLDNSGLLGLGGVFEAPAEGINGKDKNRV